MHATIQKPMQEILSYIKDGEKVFVVGCGNCAAVCPSGAISHLGFKSVQTVAMMTAARAVSEMGGGLVAAVGDELLASVPLPIGGLMSDQPIETVREQVSRLVDAAHELGSSLSDPFMTLGFLALEVIPSLKLTDQGLVDVDEFDFVPLFVE